MSIDEALKELEENSKNVRFTRLLTICEHFLGKPRIKGSHHIYKTPWAGDPRINIQEDGGEAKSYQVRQVLQVLKRLKESGA